MKSTLFLRFKGIYLIPVRSLLVAMIAAAQATAPIMDMLEHHVSA